MPFTNPFDHNITQNEIFRRILNGETQRISEDIDENMVDLIKKLLTPDPIKRIGYRSYNEITQHPYFSEYYNCDDELIAERVVPRPFRVDVLEIDHAQQPIPQQILFQIENGDLNINDTFDIGGFTYEGGYSRVSQQ